jgi:hypothetical protein
MQFVLECAYQTMMHKACSGWTTTPSIDLILAPCLQPVCKASKFRLQAAQLPGARQSDIVQSVTCTDALNLVPAVALAATTRVSSASCSLCACAIRVLVGAAGMSKEPPVSAHAWSSAVACGCAWKHPVIAPQLHRHTMCCPYYRHTMCRTRSAASVQIPLEYLLQGAQNNAYVCTCRQWNCC